MNNKQKQDGTANQAERNNKGHWVKGMSGNRNGRPANAEIIRQLLEPRKNELVSKAVELALEGDTTALKICLDRLAPPRLEASIVLIEGMEEAGTILEKSDLIINSLSSGKISIEDAEKFLGALQLYSKVVEVHDLEKRIELLEAKETLSHEP